MGQISKVGVVGLGTMGAGVVEVLARAGVDVIGVEVSARTRWPADAHRSRSPLRVPSSGAS